jgi:hypothetical protein
VSKAERDPAAGSTSVSTNKLVIASENIRLESVRPQNAVFVKFVPSGPESVNLVKTRLFGNQEKSVHRSAFIET